MSSSLDMAATLKKLESEVTSLRNRLEATTASLSEQKSEAVRITPPSGAPSSASGRTRLERAEAKIEKLQSTLDNTRADLSTAQAERG